ncbi:MAG: DUF58 domain-containing protein [Candidatus Bipolaricaulaceae bacterium]
MSHPKVRLEFLLFLGWVFVALGLRQPGLLALALPLGWHLVLATLLARPRPERELEATRRVHPGRAHEGDTVAVTVEVRNKGPRTLEVFLQDEVPSGLEVLEGKTEGTFVVGAGAAAVLSYRVRAARGAYRFACVGAEVREPLGLAPSRAELPCPGQALVLPRVERGLALEPGARRALPIPGTARSRRGGLGVEFFGVRELRPGDLPRKLAWKAMARLDAPMVVEFVEERATEVALILDTRRRVYRHRPELFEHAVRAAATLAHHFLRQGHRVGLLQYGTILDWVFPGYGRRHAERILRELARAQLGDSEVFAELVHLPTRLFPAGSLLVILSPLALGDEETLGQLAARGYRVWAIVPEGGAPVGGRGREAEWARRIVNLERAVLLRRVQRSRATVVVWPVDRPLAAVLRRARRALCR